MRVIKSQAFDDIIIVVSIIPETITSILIFVGDLGYPIDPKWNEDRGPELNWA